MSSRRELKGKIRPIHPQHPDYKETRDRGYVDNRLAKKLLHLWRQAVPDADILPGIGLPSQNGKGYMVICHTDGTNVPLKINCVPSTSFLANYASYSVEFSKGKYVNIYQISLPDIPGHPGERSTVQVYVNHLSRQGLEVATTNIDFLGGSKFLNDHGVIKIQHYAIGLDPIEFTKRTLHALQQAFAAIDHRALLHPDEDYDHTGLEDPIPDFDPHVKDSRRHGKHESSDSDGEEIHDNRHYDKKDRKHKHHSSKHIDSPPPQYEKSYKRE
jgi:hypothetical protein